MEIRAICAAIITGLVCGTAVGAEDKTGPETAYGPLYGSSAGDDSGCGACCSSSRGWTVSADALFLERGGEKVVLGQTTPVNGGPPVDVLGSNDVDLGMRGGVRLAIAHRTNCDIAWEGVYFGLQNRSGGRSIAADPFGPVPTLATSPWTQSDKFVGGFETGLSYQESSTLNNAELNLRKLLADNDRWAVETLVGVRYFEWDEDFSLHGADAFFNDFENIEVHTGNRLLGPQVGGTLRRSFDRLQFEARGKVGLMANIYGERRSNLNSTGVLVPGALPAFVPYDDSQTRTGVSALLDFSLIGSYQVTGHISAHGGYQLLYVNGLALGPNQLGAFDHSGDMFLHGPTAGLELAW